MITPISFSPISFKSTKKTTQKSEPTQFDRAKKNERIQRQIEIIEEKIFRLEAQCMRAEKPNPAFDRQKALQEIGRLVNRKSILQSQLYDNLDDIFRRLY